MNCIIVSESAGFPWGMAASTRVRNIGKALINQGINVHYFGIRGTNVTFHEKIKSHGIVDGILYSYPGGFTIRPKSWLLRRIDDFLGKWLTLIKILSLKGDKSIDVVVIYSRNASVVTFWAGIFKIFKIKVILELCEWPLSKKYSTRKERINAERFCKHAILKVDAIVPISKYIENETLVIARNNDRHIPTFRIPILTDFTSAQNLSVTHEPNTKHMLYSGSISYMDIAFFIVDVISILKAKGVYIKLKITGGGNLKLFNQLREYINKKDVIELIVFTGQLNEKELFQEMEKAYCLLAPIPDDDQSKARFPTKLGFYLASGRPVITTSIGSITEYLSDGVNAYISELYDSDSFADKIIEALNNPLKSDLIGKNGQQVALNSFYYKNASKGLREFIQSI